MVAPTPSLSGARNAVLSVIYVKNVVKFVYAYRNE